MRKAFLSVCNKTGVAEFAKALVELGFLLFASGGTCKHLRDAGLEVTDWADVIGAGPSEGHLVVTISREMALALITPHEKREKLEAEGGIFFDLLCVDFYDNTKVMNDPDFTLKDVIDHTDVGGPTMAHAAAKGGRIVLVSAAQRELVLTWLRKGEPGADRFVAELCISADEAVRDHCDRAARQKRVLLETGRV